MIFFCKFFWIEYPVLKMYKRSFFFFLKGIMTPRFGSLQSWHQSLGFRSYMGVIGHYGERIRVGKMVDFN